MQRAIASGALALSALSLAACGKRVFDAEKLEQSIKDNIETAPDLKVKSVDCPNDQRVGKGKDFDCTATNMRGEKVKIHVIQTNGSGAVRFVVR